MVKILYQTPVCSTSFCQEAYLTSGTEIPGQEIRFLFRSEGKLIEGGIRFIKVSAMRTRAERCCKVRHIEHSYDTLIEIENSEWAQEIYEDTAIHNRNWLEFHHYMIYLDSVGCFEFIADSFETFENIIE